MWSVLRNFEYALHLKIAKYWFKILAFNGHNTNCCVVYSHFSLCVSRQNRRWSPAQAREFLHLHSTLALITLHSDLGPQRTQGETLNQNLRVAGVYVFVQSSSHSDSFTSHLLSCVAPGGFKLRVSNVPSSTPLLPLHADILASLFTPEGQPYLLEVTYKPTWLDLKCIFVFLPVIFVIKGYKRTRQCIQSHDLFIWTNIKRLRISLTDVLSLSLWIFTGDVCYAWVVRPSVCHDRDGDLQFVL